MSPDWLRLRMPQTPAKKSKDGDLQGSSSTRDFQDSEKFKGKNSKGLNPPNVYAWLVPLSLRGQDICRAVLGTESCALLLAPQRTQRTLQPPPQVTGACPIFPSRALGDRSPPSPWGLSGAGDCLSSPQVQACSPRGLRTKQYLTFRNQK